MRKRRLSFVGGTGAAGARGGGLGLGGTHGCGTLMDLAIRVPFTGPDRGSRMGRVGHDPRRGDHSNSSHTDQARRLTIEVTVSL